MKGYIKIFRKKSDCHNCSGNVKGVIEGQWVGMGRPSNNSPPPGMISGTRTTPGS